MEEINTRYQFRAKNGQVAILENGTVLIGRKGVFATCYQWITQGATRFDVADVEDVIYQKPTLMRGYLQFWVKTNDKVRKSTVWLTNPQMDDAAQKAIKVCRQLQSQGLAAQ